MIPIDIYGDSGFYKLTGQLYRLKNRKSNYIVNLLFN